MLERRGPSPYVIAEIGINHDGDVGRAEALVRMAADAGADAVKFQTFVTASCIARTCELADYQKRNGVAATSQYDMLRPLELSADDHRRLKDLADAVGVDFLSTPDDSWSLALLVSLEVKAIKVASAEIDNLPFLAEIAQAGKPVLLSTGMSDLDEVRRAVDRLIRSGAPEVALMHCTSNYPCLAGDANLLAIPTLRAAFGGQVGYSDHTLGIEAGVMAVALGAQILEKHVTLDDTAPGPDHAAAATPEMFRAYVRAVRTAAEMLGDGDKVPRASEIDMRHTMRRSIVAARALAPGETIRPSDIAFKRAGAGISPAESAKMLGRIVANGKQPDEPLHWDDLTDA